MKPAGTIEADFGRVNASTGVQWTVSVVWYAGRTYLELREEPQGEPTPKRQYRHFHIRSDRLPDLIGKLVEADNMITARRVRHTPRGRGPSKLSPPLPRGPAGSDRTNSNPVFSRARAGQSQS